MPLFCHGRSRPIRCCHLFLVFCGWTFGRKMRPEVGVFLCSRLLGHLVPYLELVGPVMLFWCLEKDF